MDRSDVIYVWSQFLIDPDVIDFGNDMAEEAAALYEGPFEHVLKRVASGRKDGQPWFSSFRN